MAFDFSPETLDIGSHLTTHTQHLLPDLLEDVVDGEPGCVLTCSTYPGPAGEPSQQEEEDPGPAEEHSQQGEEDPGPAEETSQQEEEDPGPAEEPNQQEEEDPGPAGELSQQEEEDPGPAEETSQQEKEDPGPAEETSQQEEEDPGPAGELSQQEEEDPGPAEETSQQEKEDPGPAEETSQQEEEDPGPTEEPNQQEEEDPGPAEETSQQEEEDPGPTEEPNQQEEEDPGPAGETSQQEKEDPGPAEETSQQEEEDPGPAEEPNQQEEEYPGPAEEPSQQEEEDPGPAEEPNQQEEENPGPAVELSQQEEENPGPAGELSQQEEEDLGPAAEPSQHEEENPGCLRGRTRSHQEEDPATSSSIKEEEDKEKERGTTRLAICGLMDHSKEDYYQDHDLSSSERIRCVAVSWQAQDTQNQDQHKNSMTRIKMADGINLSDSEKSPSLKQQALEAELCPSPPGTPQEDLDHPPCTKDHQNLTPSLHSLPKQEQDIISTSLTASPVQRPSVSLSEGSSSECLMTPSPSPLLQRLAVGDCPVPSPRSHNLSLGHRFNTDPETAPSPPCSQHIRMAHYTVRTEPAEGANKAPSVTTLNRHIQNVRKRIRRFEEHFEQERQYRPAHNDRTAHPEVSRLMRDLTKSRKQLKELKLKQCAEGLREQHKGGNTGTCRSTSEPKGPMEHYHNSNNKPSLEETIDSLMKRLMEKREEEELPDNIKEMTPAQMAVEKVTLQKCLLYFESLYGRPSTRQEKTLMKPLYDRYRQVKQQLLCSPTTIPVITTIEEEEGSDEECVKDSTWLPHTALRFVSSDESLRLPHSEVANMPLVSPLEEIKGLQPPNVTTATLHEASRSELLEQLRVTRAEKKRLRSALRAFEDHFYTQTGRAAQKEDRGPMAEEYCEYKNLKAKLRLLEVLLSKRDTPKTV
ncbi:protein FAM13C-like isoform X2 [Oncorhynchus masou masou]|uniref:protein FAM13C-like isoform X2 n=1 Tax=Oncorhynchus masou masou TaxID=90313 RepID=UPI003183996D